MRTTMLKKPTTMKEAVTRLAAALDQMAEAGDQLGVNGRWISEQPERRAEEMAMLAGFVEQLLTLIGTAFATERRGRGGKATIVCKYCHRAQDAANLVVQGQVKFVHHPSCLYDPLMKRAEELREMGLLPSKTPPAGVQ